MEIFNLDLPGYSLAMAVNALVAFLLGLYVLNKRDYQGGFYFAMLMISLFVWASAEAFEFGVHDYGHKVLCSKISYVGIVTSTPFWVLFSLAYMQKYQWLTIRTKILIWIIPALTLLMVFTNDWHYLAWPEMTPTPTRYGIVIMYQHGIVIYSFMAYSYIMLFFGSLLLLSHALHIPPAYRGQAITIVIGSLFPWLGNIFYMTGNSPLPGLDPTPAFFCITGVFAVFSIFKYKMLDILPVSRDLLLTNLIDGVILVDEKDRITDINHAGEDIFKAGKLTGIKITNCLPEWNTYVADTESQNIFSREIQLSIDNFLSWYEISITPIINKQVQRSAYVVLLHNIDDRKRYEDVIKASEANLMELNSVKDKFFNIIAHDLMSPFQAILGYSEMLKNNYDEFSDSEKRTFVGSIRDSAESTYKLLRNLLEWSRLQSGRIEYVPKNVDLFEIIEDVNNLKKHQAYAKDIKIYNHTLKGIVVSTDTNILNTVLRNLISNAIKFSFPGSEIHINGIVVSEKEALVTIRDNGIGMKEDQKQSLFKLDQKISSTGTANEKGSGLGLIICKEFVEKLGGVLTIDSKEGKGTTVSFNLPLAI